MIRSLNTAVSGMQQMQQKLDVIGNNIANVNTTGYKSARSELTDSFSQTLRQASGTGAGIQIGLGTTTAATKTLFTQGGVTRTGVSTDLAISGEGFFTVKDTVADVEYATRAGNFRIDENGYLVTNSGFRVQGYSDMALSTAGDVLIDASSRPATADPLATMTGYAIDRQGKVNVKLSDGTEYVRGQILLTYYNDPQALVKEGDNLYSATASAGAQTAAAPGSGILGSVESEALELSNVDLASEFAGLIVTQRAFQANARVIGTSDEVLQELVNLKR